MKPITTLNKCTIKFSSFVIPIDCNKVGNFIGAYRYSKNIQLDALFCPIRYELDDE